MIIHVDGPLGSNKAALKERLQKYSSKFVVIDLDAIDDDFGLMILNDKKYDKLYNTKANENKFFKLKDKLNNKMIGDILKKNKKQTVIFIGATMELGNPDYKFTIKMDAATIHKQLNLKTLNDVNKSYKEISELLNNDKISTFKKDMYIMFKYKIRAPFLFDEFQINGMLARRNLYFSRKNYEELTSDEIYDKIIKLV